MGLRPDGAVWMNGGEIEINQVRIYVERALSENPEGQVVLIADKGAKTGDLVQVMDQIKLAGVPNISISADEPS